MPKAHQWFGAQTVLCRFYLSLSPSCNAEPDGAGDLPGAPLGFQSARSLEQKRALVRSLDPHHPAFVSLNCLRAAPFYAATADVLMVDPYPIGIDLHKGCNATYGVNGCGK